MPSLLRQFTASPTLVRVLPFVLFVLLTVGQGWMGESSPYWVYLAKTVLGLGMIAVMWRPVAEMRWAFSREAIVVGTAVAAVWIGLDGRYPPVSALLAKLGLAGVGGSTATQWNPEAHFGPGSGLAWLFIAVRVFGSVVVVPPLEEVFYRSFLYRYASNPAFLALPLNHFAAGPFLVISLIFGFAHFEWLPGVLCGLAFQALVVRKNRLGDAMTAHAITNLLLAVWVVWRGAWHFW